MADPATLALFSAQALNDPAPAGAIDEAERSIGRTLPQDYCAFLAVSDGYDDEVGKAHLSLWPAGQLSLRNEMYEVPSRIADLVLIGSDGGGTVYGIDWAGGAPQFVCVPFASMERAEIRALAATFADFLALVAAGEAR
jgi:cell wall assembly regulator SMI1